MMNDFIHNIFLRPVPALLGIAIWSMILSGTSLAHFPVHRPPPAPAESAVRMSERTATISEPSESTPGSPTRPAGLRSAPPGPSMRGTGSAGLTRKSRRPTSARITWEVWWARNQYQYLDFPTVKEQTDLMFPLTPNRYGGGRGTGTSLEVLQKKSIYLFRPFLDDPSARLRRTALIGLALLDDKASFPRMLEKLRDGNQTVRDSALLALGLLDHGPAKHCLLHLAKGTPWAHELLDQSMVPDYFKGFAQLALALDGSEGIDNLLRAIVADPKVSMPVKSMALEGLGLLGDEDSAKFLMDFIETGRAAPELMATAISALGKTSVPMTVPFLKKCLLYEDLPSRQSAALGLGRIAPEGDAEIAMALFKAYRHSNDQALKGFALVSLGRLGGHTAFQHLMQAATRGSRSDMPWACLGLGFALQHGANDQAKERLIYLADTHSNRSTRSAAVIALGLGNVQAAVEPLIRMLERGDDPYYRSYCALALGMIKDVRALGPLRKVLKEEQSPTVRTQAALALALMRDRSAIPELTEVLLTSSNDSTKSFVALSLAFMGDYRIVEDIHYTLIEKELDDLTLSHCVHLTAKLLSGRILPYLDRLAAGSNFACEYPLVAELLDYGI
jgi:HEAT repeat protein